VLTPKPVEVEELVAGEVGFLIATSRTWPHQIGDTITDDDRPAIEPLPGFEEIKPMVFAGLYTVDAHEHTQLRDCRSEKLRLNIHPSFFEPESSVLWFGSVRVSGCPQEIIRSGWSASTTWNVTTHRGRYRVRNDRREFIRVDNPSRGPTRARSQLKRR